MKSKKRVETVKKPSHPSKVEASQAPHSVMIVEDDDALRQALQRVFGECPDLRVAGAFSDAESALRNLLQCSPELVLMDIDLPGLSGIDCLRMTKAVLPNTRVMMVTGFNDDERVFQSLRSGADGYLLKPMPTDALLDAVRGVFSGRAAISQSIARRMIDFFRQAQAKPADPAWSPSLPEATKLTDRENAVLAKLAAGVAVKNIGGPLGITWDTVRNHIANIYIKLHVHSRTEAVLKYMGRLPDAPDSVKPKDG